jgi:hypothetical protein
LFSEEAEVLNPRWRTNPSDGPAGGEKAVGPDGASKQRLFHRQKNNNFSGGEKMKKVLLLAVLAVFVMVPFTSFAKSAISEGDLAAITAQEGVTINFDNFTVGAISIDVQSWGDGNGFTGYAGAGWVGASIDLSSNFVQISNSLTIDVGTSGAVTALGIGLPTLNLAGSMTQIITLAADSALSVNATVLGTSYISGLSMSPSGTLVITAH